MKVQLDEGYHYDGIRRSFSDGKVQRLENLIDKIVVQIAACGAAKVERREQEQKRKEESARREAIWAERERQKRIREKRAELLSHLISIDDRIHRMQQFVKKYRDCHSTLAPTSEISKFLDWVETEIAFAEARIGPEQLEAFLTKHPLMTDDDDSYCWVDFSPFE